MSMLDISRGFDRNLPVTERVVPDVRSLPVRPDLTDDEVEAVVDAVNALAGSRG